MPDEEIQADQKFRILGPLDVVVHGRPVEVTAPKQRTILATLLLRGNEWVRTGELIDMIWEDRVPAHPRESLQVHITRLRSRLVRPRDDAAPGPGDQPIMTTPGAYRLQVPPGSLDLHRHEEAVRQALAARGAGDTATELRFIRRALAEWRGDPLALVPSARLNREAGTQLREERRKWLDRRFALELASGQYAEIVADLREATAGYPYDERLWTHLLTALERSGNRGAALDAYRQLHDRLSREVGTSPGEGLRRLHERLLTPAGRPPRQGAPPRVGHNDPGDAARRPWRSQCQLPADVADFTGRRAELRATVAALRSRRTGHGPGVVSLTGAPGIGKTSLALRAAHRLRAIFPDGQWYVPMSEPDGRSRSWPEVLAELLAAAGVPAAPTDPDGGLALLQARLAHRRILIVADDVQDGGPFVRILARAPESAVLLAHRGDPGAPVRGTAQVIEMEVLSVAEATLLLGQMLGPERAGTDPAGLRELVELCGRLPLALRIAGAHLATHPGRDVAAFNDRLRAGNPLTELTLGAASRTGVRPAFHLSYQALPEATRRVFRALAVVPGMTHTVVTAAEVAGLRRAEAAEVLAELVRAYMLERNTDGGYRFHRLLARFAVERHRQEDDPAQVDAALSRLGAHYLRTADAAVGLCYSDAVRLPVPAQAAGAAGPAFGDRWTAHAWLERERRNLMAFAVLAAEGGHADVSVHLTETLRPYIRSERRYADYLPAVEAAVRCSADGGTRTAAVARLNLGLTLQGVNALTAARPHLEHALAEFRRLGTKDFEVIAINALAMHGLQQPTKRIDASLPLLRRALWLSRGLGQRETETQTLLNLGLTRHGAGDLALARHHLSAALKAGLSSSMAPEILARLGNVCCDLGDHHDAARHLRDALRLGLRARSAHSVALASYGLARVHRHSGRPARARRHLTLAISIADRDGYRAVGVNARNVLAGLNHDEGRAVAAEHEYRRALAQAERIGHPQGRCEALVGLAALARDRGHRADALHLGRQAGAAAGASGSRYLLELVRRPLGTPLAACQAGP